MKTTEPTNSKFKFIYLVIILLFLLLTIGVWMYYKNKLKQIEKDYSPKPTAIELLKTNKQITATYQ